MGDYHPLDRNLDMGGKNFTNFGNLTISGAGYIQFRAAGQRINSPGANQLAIASAGILNLVPTGALQINGAAGATAGPLNPSSITVAKGIVTAVA